MTVRPLIVVALAMLPLTGTVFTQSPPAVPAEWFQWRGPNRDGISQETGLLQDWPKEIGRAHV